MHSTLTKGFRVPDDKVVKKDSLGIVYDSSITDRDGVVHYVRHHAKGTAGGPAMWSDEHDCNPICGHHLSAKCHGCGVCLTCDGCYCFEDDDYPREDT